MKQSDKNPKYYYRVRLLREFDFLKSREAMQEVLEYIKFIKEEEKILQKIKLSRKTFF